MEPSVEFDYEAVDRNGSDMEQQEEAASDEEVAAACRAFGQIIEWVWQDGMNNPEGLQIRASIACWIFIPHLRSLTLTQLAAGFGQKKQSPGRWVEDFKRAFPRIRICHMKD